MVEDKGSKDDENKKITPANIETLMIGALTFIVSLAWNSAFQALFTRIRSLDTVGPFAYAIIVSIIAIVLSRIFIAL